MKAGQREHVTARNHEASVASRYVMWQRRGRVSIASLRALLSQFGAIEVLREKDDEYLLVRMDPDTARRLAESHPELEVEEDIQHRTLRRG